jgi:hypothetical protein
MKLFAIAFGIACSVAAVLFGIAFALLTFFDRPEAVNAAGTLAGLQIATFPKIAEFLEREEGKKNLAAGKRTPVYDFGSFQIAWPLMVLYGTIILFVVVQMCGLIAGVFGDAQLVIIGFPASALGAYFIGKWIGTRCSRRGVLAIILVAILGSVSVILADQLATDEAYQAVYNEERMVFGHMLRVSTVHTGAYLVFGLLGYWRGHTARLSKYLQYLLGVLPSETRNTVVELAFDEAQKTTLASGLAPTATAV